MLTHVLIGGLYSVSVLKKRNRSGFSIGDYFLLLFIFIYVLSVLISVGSGYAPSFNRLLATIYNLSFWLFGFFIIQGVRSESIQNRHKLQKYLTWHLVIIFVGSVITLLAFSGTAVELRSVFGLVIDARNLPRLLADSLTLKFAAVDWLGSDTEVRLSMMSPYAQALAGSMVLLLTLVFKDSNKRKLFSSNFLLVVIVIFVVACTRSRIGMLSVVLVTFFIFLSRMRSKKRMFFLIFLIMVGLTALTLGWESVYAKIYDLFWSRANSTSLRLESYLMSINFALQNNPYLGIGYKPRGVLAIPLGSHSTWIGVFLRTGFIGLAFFAGFYFFYLISSIKKILFSNGAKDKIIASGFISISAFFIFEDIDAPQYLALLFFVLVGLLDTKKDSWNKHG